MNVPRASLEMEPPRVAVVSDYTLATLGGAENAFAEQVRALASVTRVLAVCPPSERLALLGTYSGVETCAVPVSFVVPGLGFPVARNTTRLRRLLRRAFVSAGVEVVHLHSEFGIAAAAIAVARDLGIPVVQTVHTFFWQSQASVQTLLSLLGPAFYKAMTGFVYSGRDLAARAGDSALRNMTLSTALKVDAVVSPSAHQAARLLEAGLRRVHVLPNTVQWNHSARPVRDVEGPLRVLWVGRFAPEKRVLPFLRSSVAALNRVGPGALQVDLIGSGPEFRAAQRLAGGRVGIRLHGRVPSEKIPKRLAQAHVTALTSIGWDNQPMTVAESIMALRGVIWSDPKLTEGLSEAGIAAFGADTTRLADRLTALAGDPSPVLAASESARGARTTFGTERFVNDILGVYRSATHPPTASL
ncbi:glycosyltransferase family 4 protein, partial [Kocuria carniphila]